MLKTLVALLQQHPQLLCQLPVIERIQAAAGTLGPVARVAAFGAADDLVEIIHGQAVFHQQLGAVRLQLQILLLQRGDLLRHVLRAADGQLQQLAHLRAQRCVRPLHLGDAAVDQAQAAVVLSLVGCADLLQFCSGPGQKLSVIGHSIHLKSCR